MICKKCGNQLSNDAALCNRCGAPVYEQNHIPVTSNVNMSSKNNIWILVIALLIVALMICLGAVLFMTKSSTVTTNDAVATEAPQTEATQAPVAEAPESEKVDEMIVVSEPPVVEATQVPQATFKPISPSVESVSNVEGKVSEIRTYYNTVNENLNNYRTEKTGNVTKYFNSAGYLVRMNITTDSIDGLNKWFYFKNGELCFAFYFADKNTENRFYFNNGNIFRWDDEQRIKHDNEYENEQIISWHNKIVNDVNSHI